jgi:hypothetical protein
MQHGVLVSVYIVVSNRIDVNVYIFWAAIFGRSSSTTKKEHPTKNINSSILRTGVDVSVLLIFTLCFFTLIPQYYLPIGAGGGKALMFLQERV